MTTAEAIAGNVVGVHETGTPGKWAVHFRTPPDGEAIEYCAGFHTEGDARALAAGLRGVVARAIAAGTRAEMEARGL
jgi:hypothetical protein